MLNNITAYLSVLIPLIIIDAIWLTVMAKNFYGKYIGNLFAQSPNLVAVGLFYLIYSLGVTFFIVMPAIQNGFGLGKTFLMGALFGLVAYATYDLTNQATLKEWATAITLVDLFWGAILTGTISLIAVFVTNSIA